MNGQRKIASDCGWLGPDGSWHPCGPAAHKRLALDLLVRLGAITDRDAPIWPAGPEGLLEDLGWVKLIPADVVMGVPTPGFASWGRDKKPTPRQARKLLEWCLGEGLGRTELPACLAPDPPDEDLP